MAGDLTRDFSQVSTLEDCIDAVQEIAVFLRGGIMPIRTDGTLSAAGTPPNLGSAEYPFNNVFLSALIGIGSIDAQLSADLVHDISHYRLTQLDPWPYLHYNRLARLTTSRWIIQSYAHGDPLDNSDTVVSEFSTGIDGFPFYIE